MENWKFINGYENRYLVSDLGNVKSLRKPHRSYDKVLKPVKIGSGYLCVDLGNGNGIKRFLLHRIVAEAFMPNPDNKPQVNHINGIKTDNRLENLEWSTRSENQKHAIKTGLRTARGVKNSQAKINEDIVKCVFNDKRKYKEISLEYKIAISTISGIKRGYSWTHITGLKNERINK